MASAVPGPPDLITDHAVVQPVDLVNSVQRPAVASMDHQMRVDIVDDLPASQGDPREVATIFTRGYCPVGLRRLSPQCVRLLGGPSP